MSKAKLSVVQGRSSSPADMLTREEVASLLGVSTNTIYNWIVDGQLLTETSEEGKRLIPERELARVLATRDSLQSRDWVPLAIAARVLGVTRQTLYNYTAQGKLRKKVVSGRTFVAAKSLRDHVEETVSVALEKQERLNNLLSR